MPWAPLAALQVSSREKTPLPGQQLCQGKSGTPPALYSATAYYYFLAPVSALSYPCLWAGLHPGLSVPMPCFPPSPSGFWVKSSFWLSASPNGNPGRIPVWSTTNTRSRCAKYGWREFSVFWGCFSGGSGSLSPISFFQPIISFSRPRKISESAMPPGLWRQPGWPIKKTRIIPIICRFPGLALPGGQTSPGGPGPFRQAWNARPSRSTLQGQVLALEQLDNRTEALHLLETYLISHPQDAPF